jgi:hypothetical protein
MHPTTNMQGFALSTIFNKNSEGLELFKHFSKGCPAKFDAAVAERIYNEVYLL